MRDRIIVADQAEARIYDLTRRDVPMPLALGLTNGAARLHDQDLKSDRPGRIFGRAPFARGRRRAVRHHAAGSERSRAAWRRRIVAGQPFGGTLMAALSRRLKAVLATMVSKDLIGVGMERQAR